MIEFDRVKMRYSDRTAAVDVEAIDVLEEVDADLTGEDLIEMNAKSVDDQASASEIASAWPDGKDLS